MMSTTVDTDKQDKQNEQNKTVSLCVLPLLFIQHRPLLTLLLLLLLLLLRDHHDLDGTG